MLPNLTPDTALAQRLFDTLREQSFDGVGITREAYGPGERMAHALVAEAGEALGLGPELAGADHTMLLLASTLKRMPLGIMPFGPLRDGLKVLSVDAPGRKLARAARVVVTGKDAPWLEAAGYRRVDLEGFDMPTAGEIVLDGEIYPGGAWQVRVGAPMEFLVP